MKIKQAIAWVGVSCVSFAAIAQQPSSPFQAPIVQPAAVGGPLVLNLTGVTITDQAGEPIGPIQHILLSPAGCVDMAVLSLGGQRLVPVPWQLVGGAGATRGESEVAGRATLALKVDRAVLQQAPSVAVTQLSLLTQPPMSEQIRTFYQQQAESAAGGTSSQTGLNAGVGVNATNRAGVGLTNAITATNRTGILSPTGPTNAIPGRPAFETNRPGQPTITPPGNPPPTTRPPTNRPPTAVPAPGASGTPTPNHPGQP